MEKVKKGEEDRLTDVEAEHTDKESFEDDQFEASSDDVDAADGRNVQDEIESKKRHKHRHRRRKSKN